MGSHDQALEWESHVVTIHESGHAVANVVLPLGLQEVTASVSTGGFGGVSSSGNTVGWMPELDDAEGINYRLVADMCGAAAEARFYMAHGYRARKAYAMARGNANGDYANAESLLEYSTIDLADAECGADELVDFYWDAIVDVAEALREAGGYLSGAEVEGIILGAAA